MCDLRAPFGTDPNLDLVIPLSVQALTRTKTPNAGLSGIFGNANTREKSMKSILLTSTALVAFAGAATAGGHTSVALSGEASAEYNDITGFTTSTEITATGSATLDNGVTASASLTFSADNNDAGSFDSGSVSLSTDTAGITFGYGLDGAAWASGIGDEYGLGAGEETTDGVVGNMMVGGATLYVSAPIDNDTSTDALEFGVMTDLGGWAVSAAATGAGDFGFMADGALGGADVNVGYASIDGQDDQYDIGVSLPVGPVTLGVSTDESEVITANIDYASGAISAGLEIDDADNWEVSLGYAANGVAVDASFNQDEETVLGATYDMGNGLVVGAGIEADESAYAFAEYDLGGGASAFVDYTDSAAELEGVGPSERDIAAGTTVGVSFTF